jgi:hypothetical protein
MEERRVPSGLTGNAEDILQMSNRTVPPLYACVCRSLTKVSHCGNMGRQDDEQRGFPASARVRRPALVGARAWRIQKSGSYAKNRLRRYIGISVFLSPYSMDGMDVPLY